MSISFSAIFLLQRINLLFLCTCIKPSPIPNPFPNPIPNLIPNLIFIPIPITNPTRTQKAMVLLFVWLVIR